MKFRRPTALPWEEGTVPALKEHFELRVGPSDAPSESRTLVARVGRRKRRLIRVDFVVEPSHPRRSEFVAAVTRDLNFYLVEKGESDPWGYLVHHCATAATLSSDVYWSYFPEWDDPKPYVFHETRTEQQLYLDGDRRSKYADYQWPHWKGIFSNGQFPVAVARRSFEVALGYECLVSLTDKHKIGSYLLEWRPQRRASDQGYARMQQVFGSARLEEFHQRVKEARARHGLKGAGGDPDLFLQSPRDPADIFFAEVKMEYVSPGRRFRDTLNDQQRIVFPLIEEVLKCRVKVAKVYVSDAVPEVIALA